MLCLVTLVREFITLFEVDPIARGDKTNPALNNFNSSSVQLHENPVPSQGACTESLAKFCMLLESVNFVNSNRKPLDLQFIALATTPNS